MKPSGPARNGVLGFFRRNVIVLAIFLAIIAGFALGLILKASPWASTDKVLWFTLPGKLFIRSLELLIIPMVFVGIIAATSSLSSKENLKLTLICIGFTMLTHVLSSVCAIIGAFILKAVSSSAPSSQAAAAQVAADSNKPQKVTYDVIADLLRALIPKNIFKAATSQEMTDYVLKPNSNGTSPDQYQRTVKYVDGTNLLGVLVFALLIGLSASINHKKAKAFREFFKSLNDIIITVLRWLILLAPVGIASLIVDAILDIEDLGKSFEMLGLFVAICSLSLIFYGIVVLSFVAFVCLRQNPFKYFVHFFESMLLAFASTSGAVCMHKSIEICENKLKMDKRLSRFSVPFYTALQSDGSGLFIIMSCLFLAQYNDVALSVSDYAVITIMTSILCLCLPSVPSSSIITIVVVLNSINLTSLNISMLYTAEWILDRMRTMVNVYSHCICSVISADLCKHDFDENSEPFEIKDEDFDASVQFGIKMDDNVNSTPNADYNNTDEESRNKRTSIINNNNNNNNNYLNHYAQLKTVVSQNESFNDNEI